MVVTFVALVATLLGTAVCDYPCLCNYNVQLDVFGEDRSSTIGYLYEFDCKAVLKDQSTNNYTAIAYEHQIGYVQSNDEVQKQMCPGDPSTEDIVTTQQPTMMNATTMKPATTVQKTTMQETTMQPTTMQPTTMQPTTMQPTTMQPSTMQPTTMQPSTMQPTTMQPTTMQPTTAEKVTTMQPTTTTQATTMQPATTEKATTMQPTTMMKTSTMAPATSAKSTAQPPTTLSPVTLVNQGVCPQIVQEHANDDNNIIAIRGQTCYEVVAHRAENWLHVEKDCQARGGHLVDIESADEQNFISELLSNNSFRFDVWIGLNDRHHEERFEWSSGKTLSFMNWIPGRKDFFLHSVEDCAYMTHSHNWQWDDSECSGFFERDRHYMCQYHTVDPSTVVITTPPPSPEGNTKLCSLHNINHAKQYHGFLAQYEHSCYELLPRTKYTWSHGESICHSHGGHLAHITSSAEQAFIQSFMTRHSPTHAVWIGLHDTVSEGHFEWTSGNPVAYLNWKDGHSDNFANHNVEDCVAFVPYEGGKWDDIPCGSTGIFGDAGEKHPLLCQYSTVKDVIVG